MDNETQPTKPVHYISTFAEESEHNFVAYLLYCGRVSDAVVFDDAELVGVFTGISSGVFNSVVRTHLSEERCPVRIDEVLRTIRRNAVPAGWWIWPTTQPQGLAQMLHTYGFSDTPEIYPWMALKLSSLPSMIDVQIPPNFTVELVQDQDTLLAWLQVQAAAFSRDGGQDSRLNADYLAFQKQLGFSEQAPLRRYLGRLNGQPVGTSSTFIDQGGVGLYSVSIIPEVRSSGLGRILSLVPLFAARDAGCQIATLMAPQGGGYSFYERLGFREVCRTNVHVWLPPRDA